ncbi:hypothetical protein [Halomarina oriensis]|uniref:Uncharacterized protein n=1 Tax=Halomarina oriensis TaxID=671145 RepID=A0A6B0GF72_9EURY|nr:hypothetical protein [Halomarina oriensis]MWG33606.1 hypothetical protein [Halomarina oriensis]
MRRRQVLALAAVGLAGCLSDPSPSPNGTDDGTTTPATTVTTETPESPDVGAYPGDCPRYGDSTLVCADAAPDDVPLRMTASRSSVELPGTVEFTLSNDTEVRFETNHYGALLHKRVDGEWFRIAPTIVEEPLMYIVPGDSHTWSVTLEHAPDEQARGGGDDERRVAGLGGGRYAFGNDGWFSTGNYEESVALATTFEVDAPPAALTTTGDVSEVSVEDDTVTARWSGGYDGEGSSEGTFVLRVVDGTAEHRLVTEQVLQPGGFGRSRPLRDALALLLDRNVQTARLSGSTGTTPAFGVREPTRFEYDGQSYEMSAEKAGEAR